MRIDLGQIFISRKYFQVLRLLSGDRLFSDDQSVIAGFGLIDTYKSVLVIGQEKGEDLTSRIERNFGMMRPEGYRKCIRLMQLANRFQIPVVSFIDTPGAYPGLEAEQRGQASAIATSIECIIVRCSKYFYHYRRRWLRRSNSFSVI